MNSKTSLKMNKNNVFIEHTVTPTISFTLLQIPLHRKKIMTEKRIMMHKTETSEKQIVKDKKIISNN